MYPLERELFSKSRIRLYNNLGTIGEATGRLSVSLQIAPYSDLIWEFEQLGKQEHILDLEGLNQNNALNPRGVDFTLEGLQLYGSSHLKDQRLFARGGAQRAVLGNSSEKGQHFKFYIPNLISHAVSKTQKITQSTKTQNGELLSKSHDGNETRVSSDEQWEIVILTRLESLNWILATRNSKQHGLNITTTLELRLKNLGNRESLEPNLLPALSIDEALKKIYPILKLLRISNGGHVSPSYSLASRYSKKDHPEERLHLIAVCATASARKNTDMHNLDQTWLCRTSDFAKYLECHLAISKMLLNACWRDTLTDHMVFYQQIVQNKSMIVWANSIGCLLERLIYAIVVEDTSSFKISKGDWDMIGSKQRITKMLEIMGITTTRGFDDQNNVSDFINIRNDSTHANTLSNLSLEEKGHILTRARTWIEEILLWRIGYNSGYRLHLNNQRMLEPRYDLSTRDPSW